MKQIKYWLFISTLSIALSNDGEGYRLIGNTTQDYYQDLESIFEMSFGPWDFLMNFSGRQTRVFVVPKEKQDEIISKISWSRVIATTRIDDKVEPNHGAQKQNGTSYTITNDSITGEQTSIVGNDDASIEMMEIVANDEIGSLMGSGDDGNILYPFGPDSVRYVGDIWTIEEEGKQTGKTFAFEEFEGTKKSKATYNFKKIKEKRGSKIAYIKLDNIVEIIGVGTSDDKSVECTISTTVKGDIKFNITTGLMESCKMSMSLTTVGRDLEDDSIKKMFMGMSAKIKQKLQ
jgi:hypothetical protein|tara:strand:- start:104 stop:970 length:867 start_codon:yes stop_codon:yes gene_type:complete